MNETKQMKTDVTQGFSCRENYEAAASYLACSPGSTPRRAEVSEADQQRNIIVIGLSANIYTGVQTHDDST